MITGRLAIAAKMSAMALAASGLVLCGVSLAQKPLANADVVAMLAQGKQEQTVLGTLRSHASAFDVSNEARAAFDKKCAAIKHPGVTAGAWATEIKDIWETMVNVVICRQTNGRGGEGTCDLIPPQSSPKASSPSPTPSKVPGRNEYDAITVDRGVTQDTGFTNWANSGQATGKGSPRTDTQTGAAVAPQGTVYGQSGGASGTPVETRSLALDKQLKEQMAKRPPVAGKVIRVTANLRATRADEQIIATLQRQRQAVDVQMGQMKLGIHAPAQGGIVGQQSPLMSANGTPSTTLLVQPQAKLAVNEGTKAGSAEPTSANRTMVAAPATIQKAPVGTAGATQPYSAAGNASGAPLMQRPTSAQPATNLPANGNASGSTGTNPATAQLHSYMESAALACVNNPAMRIISVSGSSFAATFTPTDQYNLYTITGCSFGNQAPTSNSVPTDWVHIYGGTGSFYGKFVIKFWSDNQIEVSLDESLTGFPDLDNINLVVKRADGQETQKGGFKFYAERATVLLKTIPQSWVTLAPFPCPFSGCWSSNYSTPPASPVPPFGASPYPKPAIEPPGPSAGSAYVSRSSDGTAYAWLSGVTDYYNFSQLAPGWTTDSFEVDPYNQYCPAGGGWTVTYKQSFGTWSASWDGNNAVVGLSDTSCSGFFAPMPLNNYKNWSGSYYALKVWVTGPRGTDPLTDKPAN